VILRVKDMHQGWSERNIDLQRRVEGRSLSLHEVMQEICDLACSVSDADGAAIAILKADQLIYEAGSGVAAFLAERRVMATLRTSGADQGTGEILRVENAETDSRIQSAICRQFGARSLLMMGFWCEGILAGILQISFEHTHKFLDAEVEAYRMLAALAERAVILSFHSERTKDGIDGEYGLPVAHPVSNNVPGSNEPSILWSRTEGLSILSHVLDVAVAAIILIASVGFVLLRDRVPGSLTVPAVSPVLSCATGDCRQFACCATVAQNHGRRPNIAGTKAFIPPTNSGCRPSSTFRRRCYRSVSPSPRRVRATSK